MRVRLLKNIGFKVLEFSVEELSKLRVHPKRLRETLAEKYYRILSGH
jgi:hypothetical protein